MTDLEQLAKEIRLCQACELRTNCTCPVPGIGEVGAKYFLIGEAPGAQEDDEGIPFVGPAGRKLDKLLDLAGIDINDCYLTNTVRCRPQKNRDPKKKEIAACQKFLWRELELVQPEVIITLGRYALSLFNVKEGVSRLHGTQMMVEVEGKEYPLICQYHPAAADGKRARLWATLLDDWENLPEIVPHSFVWASESHERPFDFENLSIVSMDTEQDGSGGLGEWSVAYRRADGQLEVAPFYGKRVPLTHWGCPVVMHNSKYDIRVLKENSLPVPESTHDTMIMAYCLGLAKQAPKDYGRSTSGSDMVGGLGLKYLARRHLGMEMRTWQDVKDAPPEEKKEYNADDSISTLLLAEKWMPQLPQHYFDIDMPLLPVLMAIEDRGVMVNPDVLTTMGRDLDHRLTEFSEDAQHLAFHRVDMISYLYGTLGIEPWKFTDGDEPSTDVEVLEVIDDPLVQETLEYKKLYKEKGTYVENYVNAVDIFSRIHPELKQTSTSTSRLSCARPNLQNVFKRDDRVKMRAMFCAPEGKKIIRADFDQLDFRTLAAITQDPTLLKALRANRKIHQVTADEMNLPYDDAKVFNFATMFGQEAWALAQTLHCTRTEAQHFLDRYYERFPNIKAYRDMMTEIAKSEKHVTIPFTNRKRRIDAMFVNNWRVQKEGIKEAINMPVQGLEAEVVKIAMIDLHYGFAAPMIMQIHDELLFEVDEDEALEYAHWIKDYMPTIVEFGGMTFPVEVGVGDSWYEAMENKI